MLLQYHWYSKCIKNICALFHSGIHALVYIFNANMNLRKLPNCFLLLFQTAKISDIVFYLLKATR